MAKSNKHRQHRQQGKRLPAGVPQDARYVNVTHLTDFMIQRSCRLMESRGIKIAYMVIGILIMLAALVYYFFNQGNVVSSVLVLLLGAMFVRQGSRLSITTANKMIREINRQGLKARDHTYFFTGEDVCHVLEDGSVRKYPYGMLERVYDDDLIVALILKDKQGIITLERDGFVKGNAKEFVDSAKNRIAEGSDRLEGQAGTK